MLKSGTTRAVLSEHKQTLIAQVTLELMQLQGGLLEREVSRDDPE